MISCCCRRCTSVGLHIRFRFGTNQKGTQQCGRGRIPPLSPSIPRGTRERHGKHVEGRMPRRAQGRRTVASNAFLSAVVAPLMYAVCSHGPCKLPCKRAPCESTLHANRRSLAGPSKLCPTARTSLPKPQRPRTGSHPPASTASLRYPWGICLHSCASAVLRTAT